MGDKTVLSELSEGAFAGYAQKTLDNILDMLVEKGRQYAGESDNALSNFLVGSQVAGINPQTYLMAQATKHWYSLGLWATGKSDQGADVVQSRCEDIIIYMLLLMWMIETLQTEGVRPQC